jgi:hypothetical protein
MSCITGEPSTAKIALLPPVLFSPTVPFKPSFIIVGSFAAINGGTNAHSSSPLPALNACNIPSLAPA